MKSLVNDTQKSQPITNFPCLMEGCTGSVVMFLSETKCVYLHKGPDTVWNVGDINAEAKINNFSPLSGSITLLNN